jgi:hypothetical protein
MNEIPTKMKYMLKLPKVTMDGILPWNRNTTGVYK